METYLFKFSACLAIFWLVYLLFLERQTMHRFKRFYLLASAALALTIPLLTVTQYIEPIASSLEVSPVFIPMASSFIKIPQEKAPFMELETVLWVIYGLGVLLFSIRFAINLFRMYRRILDNKNLSKLPFIYVLLEECRIPHSFFKYLFFDRSKYETNTIPDEVKLHEETHAKQLHSLDIIVIELLQIVFWFHPLVYLLKHHIKLNHEFLADQAVLEEGTDTKTYQTILLQFSSNTDEYQLSSAINYSSIKKRFTVMKTQTSKTRIWISSLLLLPIIAILFYSFAEKEYVEKAHTAIVQQNENTMASNLFLVTVEKNGNTIELRCENGCRWSHLTLEPSPEPYIINDFGFSEGQTMDTDKFTFSIQPNKNGVQLNGIKGTAWIDLAFSLPENQKQALNQMGITNTQPVQLDNIHNDLKKRAEENHYTKQFFSVKDKNGQYVKKRFYELSYEDKIKWVAVDPIPYTRIDVTKAHFENFKADKDYVIKLNGNYTAEEELNTYKATDFITFSFTPISELAKMKERFVLNLVTKDAYDIYLKSMIEQYRLVIEDYEKEMALSENERHKDIKEMVSTYEFLYYNYKQFTPELIKNHNLKSPTPIASDIIKKVNQSYLNIPTLFIDKNENLFLNNVPTSLKTIKEDFNHLTKSQKSELILEADGRQIHKNHLDEIMLAIGDNLKNVQVANGQALVYDPDYKSEVRTQQKPPTEKEISAYNSWAKKIHSESKALSEDATWYPPIDEEDLIKFSKIHKRMSAQQKKQAVEYPFSGLDVKDSDQNISSSPKTNQQIATKKQIAAYNAWAKKLNTAMAKAKVNNDVNAYPIVKLKDVKKYKAIYDIMTVEQRKDTEAWPSFPPLPFSPAKKNDQNKKTINPIEITIKKDNSLILNGKPIAFKDLATSVGFMNNHLTIEERRTYAMASIIIEQNNSLDFSKKVQRELLKADIGSSSVGYAESQQKEGLPTKHYSPNAGLTIAEAKAQQKQALKDYKAYEQKQKSAKKKSPWSVGVGVNSVELINDSQRKSGPIEINGASYYFSQLNGKTTYYDNYGKEVDISKIPPPPPIPNKATPEQKAKMKKATDAYMKANPNKVGKAKAKDGEVFDVIEVPEDLQGSVNINGETFYYTSSAGKTTYFNSKGKEVKMDNLPPPPPSKNPSFLEYIIEMEKKGATFFMDGKKITANEAKTIAKNNKGKGTDMLTQKDDNGKYVVKLSKQVKD